MTEDTPTYQVQRTEAWYAERLGKVTASRVWAVVARTKEGWSASRDDYLTDLVLERLTGTKQEGFSSAAMQWGTDQEPHARAAYEAHTGNIALEVGMVQHPTVAMSGASPDGLVDDDGLIEIKCPNSTTHGKTLLGAKIDKKYVLQMQWQMACTGRKWCDFVSYDPRFPEHLRLHIQRVPRDDQAIADLEKAVTEFLGEVASMVSKLEKK